MIAVVKANAYGHGSAQTAQALQKKHLADAFAVATPREGAELREKGIVLPVLVLGYADREDMEISVRHNLSQTVYSEGMLATLSQCAERLGKSASAQLKIDTGMNRIGVKGSEALKSLLKAWKSTANVMMDGMFSHFASADSDEAFTKMQYEKFREAEKAVHDWGFFPMRHISASSAIGKEDYAFDAVRAGIVLYGAAAGDLTGIVKPCQTLSTHPVRIESVKAGESIGYSRAFKSSGDMRIMTLPCGYGDGYSRLLSGKADVLVNGRRARITGNICMDMLMCDITDIENVTLDSEVVLLGAQGDESITPDELAKLQNTIPYEIMLRFSERVERQWA